MDGIPDDIEVSDRAKEQAEITGADPERLQFALNAFTSDEPTPGAEKAQKKIDEGVENALNMDFASFEEVKAAFRNDPDIPDKLKNGHGTHTCPYCKAELQVSCGGFSFGDEAYCDACEIQFTRHRTGVVEDERDGMTIVTPREEKPEYSEYYCDDCGELHEKTVPDGEWEDQSVEIGGYDDCWIRCPCGARHNGYIEAGDPIECDCGRVFELTVSEFEDCDGAERPKPFHVPSLTEDEWDEFTDRLEEFEVSDEMESQLQKHIEAIENDE